MVLDRITWIKSFCWLANNFKLVQFSMHRLKFFYYDYYWLEKFFGLVWLILSRQEHKIIQTFFVSKVSINVLWSGKYNALSTFYDFTLMKITMTRFLLVYFWDELKFFFNCHSNIENFEKYILHWYKEVFVSEISHLLLSILYTMKQSFSKGNKCMCSYSHALCYGCVWWCAIHNSFALYGGKSFVLVILKRLNVSEPKDWVTWSHRTGVNFPFLKGKRIQYFSVSA